MKRDIVLSDKNHSSYDEGIKIIDGIVSEYECLEMTLSRKQIPRTFHYHDYIELLYGVSGSTNAWIFNRCITFSAGELLIINPGEAHTFTTASDESSSYIVIKFLPSVIFSADISFYISNYMLSFNVDDFCSTRKRVFSKDKINDIDALMRQSLYEWNTKQFGYDLIIRSNITKIFLSALRHLQNIQTKSIHLNSYNKIETVIKYINQNLSTANMHTAAEICGLSYSYFSRTFKNLLGKSFSEYLNIVRITQAERLLLSSQKTVTEIAYETGFSSTSHFIKAFHAQKKISPKQFRLCVISGTIKS